MARLELIVVGCGKRVRETALPALHALGGAIAVRAVYARSARRVELGGRAYEVAPLEALAQRDLAGAALVYVAVGKDAVPGVLARLARLEVGALDLLIDTPVVRFRRFRHARLSRAFRRASVAEDCIELPWLDALRALESAGVLGAPRAIELDRSAYAYHGLATAKAALGARRVLAGRRVRLPGGGERREVALYGGKRMVAIEPRDYSVGTITVRGERASVSDAPGADLRLEPLARGSALHGFRAGDVRVELAPEEVELASGDPERASVTARQEALKRVGFLRLWKRLLDGRPAYPIEDALEDTVADYYLERFGRWRSTALTSPRSPLARAWMELALR
jgi:hypothetical protein